MKNNKSIIIIGAVLIGMLVGYYFTSSSGSNNSNQTANIGQSGFLAAKENFYDFGEILMRDGIVEHGFEIENTSDAPVKIEKIYTSCMCTTATIEIDGKEKGPFGMPGHSGTLSRANTVVDPGKKALLKVFFDPAAHGPSGVGLMERTVYLETGSEKTPQMELNIRAVVK